MTLSLLLIPCFWGVESRPGQFQAHTSDNDQKLVGAIEKRAEGEARLITKDKTKPVHAFDSVTATQTAQTSVPLRPFQLHWDPGQFMNCNTPRFAGNLVSAETPIGAVALPVERLWAVRSNPIGRLLHAQSFDEGNFSTTKFVSPPSGLMLDNANRRFSLDVERPIESGLVLLRYYDDGVVDRGSTWTIELLFGDRKHRIALEGGWNSALTSCRVEGETPIASLAAARSTGWHSLRIEFSPRSLFVSNDGSAMVFSSEKGLSQALSNIEISVKMPKDGARKVWFDDLAIFESDKSIEAPNFDQSQTVVTTRDAGSCLGLIDRSDDQTLTLKMFDQYHHSISWQDINAIWQPRVDGAKQMLEGEIGDIALQSFAHLTVGLSEADDNTWTLKHPLLGTLRVPRSAVNEWRPRVVGKRLELYNGCIHLGNRIVEHFYRPRPDSLSFKVEFEANSLGWESSQRAQLCLWVRGLEGVGPTAAFAAKIRDGSLRAQLFLNGDAIDYLNAYVDNRSDECVELRIPLNRPKAGARNTIEIRLQQDPETGLFDEFELAGSAIEIGILRAPSRRFD